MTSDGTSSTPPRSTTTPRTTWRSCAIDGAAPPLPLATTAGRGEPGAVLGYPENGPFSAAAARFGETRDVISEDSYGNGPIRRSISSLRGSVRSGNSGGPLVDADGRVLGTVFATTTVGNPGGFASPTPSSRPRSPRPSPKSTPVPCTG